MGLDDHQVPHVAAVASVAALVGVALTTPPGAIRRLAVGGIGLLAVVAGLYALFGDGDWTAGGWHRRGATFLFVYAALAIGGSVALRSVTDPFSGVGQAVQTAVLVCSLVIAGWLAYVDAFERLEGRLPAGRSGSRD